MSFCFVSWVMRMLGWDPASVSFDLLWLGQDDPPDLGGSKVGWRMWETNPRELSAIAGDHRMRQQGTYQDPSKIRMEACSLASCIGCHQSYMSITTIWASILMPLQMQRTRGKLSFPPAPSWWLGKGNIWRLNKNDFYRLNIVYSPSSDSRNRIPKVML